MKKENHIVAKAALGTFLFVLGIGMVFNSWEKSARLHNELLEIEMNVDELYYYVSEDTHNGNLKKSIEWAYIKELDKISESLENLRNE